MEQIFEIFLQGSSCLMMMHVALQRTLLSEFLFCTTKSGIMMGQLLLSTRLSPTRLELWQHSSHFISNAAGSGHHNCPQRAFWCLCWIQRSHPCASHPMQSSICLGEALGRSPVPRALAAPRREHNLAFSETLAQRVEHHASILSDENSYCFCAPSCPYWVCSEYAS